MHLTVARMSVDPVLICALPQLIESKFAVCLCKVECACVDLLIIILVRSPGIGRSVNYADFHSADVFIRGELTLDGVVLPCFD